MKARTFDEKFDKDESILRHLDLSKAIRPWSQQRRVNVDFPVWMIESLDKEAKRLGVTRQSIIKVWIAERLQKHA
ncbi:CopG family transcriptional regulator [Candidatus Methylomirabilis sp.]|uniref:type II toxin-antitoxin system BrnA family antitoxin n=1 Tax=Candidatus Methylomirabilis sp. TaxID=2032687 RepID=UPI0030762F14